MAPSNPVMADGEREAYNAPYPSDEYKAGARMFPELVPTRDANSIAFRPTLH